MKYKYDVAISFAEEDRNVALAISLALEIEGVESVYYYPLHYETTWGKNLKMKLEKIYSEEARYALILLSDKYFEKAMTQLELDSIKKRMHANEDIVYMVPVKLDNLNNEISKQYFELGYFEWAYNPKELAKTIVKLLGEEKEIVKANSKTFMHFKNISVIAEDIQLGNVGINMDNNVEDVKEIENSTFHATKKFQIGNINK